MCFYIDNISHMGNSNIICSTAIVESLCELCRVGFLNKSKLSMDNTHMELVYINANT